MDRQAYFVDARTVSVINALVRQRLARNRWHAQQLIEEGRVFFKKHCISNIGEMVAESVPLRLVSTVVRREQRPQPSSNLLYAMSKFRFSAKGRIAVDLGLQEGDCSRVLLEEGVRRLFAISIVGGGGSRFVDEPRVTLLDRVDIRHLHRGFLPLPLSAIIVDSRKFGIEVLLESIQHFAAPSCWLVAFIYPDIENKRRVLATVRDKHIPRELMIEMALGARDTLERFGNWRVLGAVAAPHILDRQEVQSIMLAAEHLTIT